MFHSGFACVTHRVRSCSVGNLEFDLEPSTIVGKVTYLVVGLSSLCACHRA